MFAFQRLGVSAAGETCGQLLLVGGGCDAIGQGEGLLRSWFLSFIPQAYENTSSATQGTTGPVVWCPVGVSREDQQDSRQALCVCVVCVCVCVCMCVRVCVCARARASGLCRSVVSDSFVTSWTVAHQAPLSMGFSRQEYWSGLPFPPRENLSDPGTKPVSRALEGKFFTSEPPGKP